MKKAFAISLISFLASSTSVLAQGIVKIQNPSTFNSLEDIINTALGLVRPIVVLTLVAVLMYGGWVYLTAQDDDSKVAKSKSIITAAVIGFIIIVLAPAVVQLVGSLLGVQGGLFTGL